MKNSVKLRTRPRNNLNKGAVACGGLQQGEVRDVYGRAWSGKQGVAMTCGGARQQWHEGGPSVRNCTAVVLQFPCPTTATTQLEEDSEVIGQHREEAAHMWEIRWLPMAENHGSRSGGDARQQTGAGSGGFWRCWELAVMREELTRPWRKAEGAREQGLGSHGMPWAEHGDGGGPAAHGGGDGGGRPEVKQWDGARTAAMADDRGDEACWRET